MKMTEGSHSLINWFSSRAERNQGVISPFSYREAAKKIGLDNWRSNAQFFGQLQSRVDFACYKVGLPPLGLTAEKAFKNAWATEQRSWSFPVKEMAACAQSRTWSADDFLKISTAANTIQESGRFAWDEELEKNEEAVRLWATSLIGIVKPMPERQSVGYWWVNQNQTYLDEVSGGFLWSPKERADGARNQFYDYMTEVRPGDVIFSFCDTKIKAIGIAVGVAKTSPKPDFGNAGGRWSKEGWFVPVEFKELTTQIRPKDHISKLIPYLPQKYSPLQPNGNGLQAAYLTRLNKPLANELIDLIGAEYQVVLDELAINNDFDTKIEADIANADAIQEAIEGRTDIVVTTKSQLINARRGQGIFKANVRLNEKRCRVTGIKDITHLRASHIKPWRFSSDSEKLNGCNGLLLAPHVDHLFDKGWISFTDNGDILVSPTLRSEILDAWGISRELNVGKFNDEQKKFLEFHRTEVFES